MYNLFFPLILTIIIEFIIIWLFIKDNPLKLFFYSILVNMVTLPLATYLYIYFYQNLLVLEGSVFMVEALLLKFLLELDYKKAILISLTANFTTFMVGIILGYYI